MVLKKILALGSVALAASAFAQTTPLGTITEVIGVVTVTTEGSAGAATVGMPVHDRSRVVASASGGAVVQLDSGCTVTVRSGQGVNLMKNMPCQALNASTHPSGRTSSSTSGGTDVIY